jgi:hypothetical protein
VDAIHFSAAAQAGTRSEAGSAEQGGIDSAALGGIGFAAPDGTGSGLSNELAIRTIE